MNNPQKPNPKRFRKAFTLVEMLVSISIIVVLATIGFITMKKAKEGATAAVDAGEMRQISGAIIMYASDHNDLLPTTSGGISPFYKKNQVDLCSKLAIYFGYDNPQEKDFIPEFAAAAWQTANGADNGPSMRAERNVYSGPGRPANHLKPEPYINPMGYALNPKTDSMRLSAAMSKMTDPAASLILIEIDRELPNMGTPGWISAVPEKMAHGTYRLGLYWDGHVGRLNKNMEPM